jgi:hypothetical protein
LRLEFGDAGAEGFSMVVVCAQTGNGVQAININRINLLNGDISIKALLTLTISSLETEHLS